MAKALGIRIPSGLSGIAGSDSIDKDVLTPVVNTGTLGSIVDSIIKSDGAPDEMVICVDINTRTVHARLAAGVDAVALIDAVTGTAIAGGGSLKQLVDARSSVFIHKDSSAVAITFDVSSATTLEIVAAAPNLVSRNIASLVNAIDDDLALVTGYTVDIDRGADFNPIIVIDQHTAFVTLFNVAAANIATVRALFDDGGSLEDLVRYEQIPASEVSGAAVLAFE